MNTSKSAVSLVVALAMFVALAVLCFTVKESARYGLPLFFVVPITLLGVRWGWHVGLGGAILGLSLVGIWAAVDDVDANLGDVLGIAIAFLVAGVVVGRRGGAPEGIETADTRWFEMSNDMLVEASLEGYFTRLSDRWETCLGWSKAELMARPFREFIHPDDLGSTNVHADALEVAPGEVVNLENRYLAKDGSWRWLLWSARSDDQRKYAVARDITDRKELEEERLELLLQLDTLARTDALTGLPNRRSWDEELRRAIARAGRSGHRLALAIIDLDHFKRFNDTHGHAAGDALLIDAALSWSSHLRASDFLARYGGEEFAILLPECAVGEAELLLDRLRSATPQHQTCSVGVAFLEPADAPEELMGRADAALYEAKRSGRDRLVAAR